MIGMAGLPDKRWQRTVLFIETFCRAKRPNGDIKLVKLLPWQKKFIREVWGDSYERPAATRALLTMAKKNGKTGLLAWLFLAYLVGPEKQYGEVVASAAGASKDQAGLAYEEMQFSILLEPRLSERLVCYDREMRITNENFLTRYQAISTYHRAAQGLKPIFFAVDEFAQAKDTKVWDALDRGQGARENAVGVMLSTDSDVPGSPYKTQVDMVEELHKTGRGKSWVSFIYRSDPKKSPFSWANVRAANPSLGHHLTRESVAREMEEAKASPVKLLLYETYRLNRSSGGVARLVDINKWQDAAADFDWKDMAGERCRLGLDLSKTTDLTALAAWFPDSGRLLCHAWMPAATIKDRGEEDRLPYEVWASEGWLSLCRENGGAAINFPDVIGYIDDLRKKYKVEELRYDAWGMSTLKEQALLAGCELPNPVPYRQGTVTFSPAINEFERLLLSGQLAHNDNPVLNSAVANTGAEVDLKATDPPRKPVKLNERSRIDCVVASLMAISTIEPKPEAKPKRRKMTSAQMVPHEMLAG